MMENTTQLAYERTRLACERTLMAWIRTAFSLISFGFTIYKFFGFQAGRSDIPTSSDKILSPRVFAMAMITIGVVALTLATIEERRTLIRLAQESGTRHRSVAIVVAALVSAMGMVALVVVLLGG
jgi:putative membrane protein